MKLSYAIKKGMVGTKQIYHSMFGLPSTGECCALGAAVIGAGGNPRWSDHYFIDTFMVNAIPSLKKNKLVTNPVTQMTSNLKHVVIQLNDTHRWPRTRIINWLKEQGL